MSTVKIYDRITGKEKIAVYGITASGNKRYSVDGVFISDKEFDKKYTLGTNTHEVIKIYVHDDREKVKYPKWHLIQDWGDTPRILCDGSVFLMGDGDVKYDIKEVERGGITCPECLSILKHFKDIRL